LAYAVVGVRALLGLVFAVSAMSQLRSSPAFPEFRTSLTRLG